MAALDRRGVDHHHVIDVTRRALREHRRQPLDRVGHHRPLTARAAALPKRGFAASQQNQGPAQHRAMSVERLRLRRPQGPERTLAFRALRSRASPTDQGRRHPSCLWSSPTVVHLIAPSPASKRLSRGVVSRAFPASRAYEAGPLGNTRALRNERPRLPEPRRRRRARAGVTPREGSRPTTQRVNVPLTVQWKVLPASVVVQLTEPFPLMCL